MKSDKKTRQEIMNEFKNNVSSFEKKLSLSGRGQLSGPQLPQKKKRTESSLDQTRSPYLEQPQQPALVSKDQIDHMFNKRRSSQ